MLGHWVIKWSSLVHPNFVATKQYFTNRNTGEGTLIPPPYDYGRQQIMDVHPSPRVPPMTRAVWIERLPTPRLRARFVAFRLHNLRAHLLRSIARPSQFLLSTCSQTKDGGLL